MSGVIAECRVVSAVKHIADDIAAAPFWVEKTSMEAQPRVELVVIRVATSTEILKRDWLRADPILSDLSIFKMAQSTNFRVSEHQATRLRALWERTGSDWTWCESVVGLWAYVATKDIEVSRLPGSPVSRAAIGLGRAVSGVYNKVMNFRSLDPTDSRKGMSGASDMDREVWKTFFSEDDGKVDRDRLDEEIARFGIHLSSGTFKDAVAFVHSQEQRRVDGDLKVLLKRYHKAQVAGVFDAIPKITTSITQTFARNPLVVEIAKQRAGFKCEIPDCKTPTFLGENNQSYCEVHHVRPLSDGGEDTVQNTICLCPMHHREAHLGKGKGRLMALMQRIRAEPSKVV